MSRVQIPSLAPLFSPAAFREEAQMGEVLVALLVLGAFIWLANKATTAARAVEELQPRLNLRKTELRVRWRDREPRPPVVPPAAEPPKPAPVVAPPPVSVT